MSRKRQRQREAAILSTADSALDEMHVKELVVVRESDASDEILFYEMIYKTAHAHVAANPDLALLPEIGLGPFHTPEKFRATVIGDAKARTALFMCNRTLVMYHMGSAAMSDASESNVFTDRLIEVLERHQARRLRLYAIHRLIRDRENAARIEVVVRKHAVIVITNDVELDLRKPPDQLVWALLSSFAAAERDSIVERNTLGRIAQARRGEWPHGRQHVPFGYVLENKTIRPDPGMVPHIRQMLLWMSDPALTSAELVRRIGGLGLSRPRTKAIHGVDGTMAEVRHPKDVRASLDHWLPLYESGVYRMELPCPTSGHEQFGGLPVFRMSESDARGFVELSYNFGLPEGGWADPSVFEAIRQRRAGSVGSQATSRASMKSRRPFSGRPRYTVDGTSYRLDCSTANGYRLQRITTRKYTYDAEEGRALADSRHELVETATTVATIDAGELHSAVADGVVAALSSPPGCGGLFGGPAHMQRPSSAQRAIDQLRARIERIEARAAGARMAAAEARDPRVVAKFIEDAEHDERELEQSYAQVISLESNPDPSAQLEPAVGTDTLLRALVAIRQADGVVANEVAAAVLRVMPRFELHPTDMPAVFTWLVTVSVPLTDGYVLELGPITGDVKARSAAAGEEGKLASTRVARIVERFAQGEDIRAAAAIEGRSLQNARRAVFDALVAGGFPKAAAYHLRAALVPELRMLAGTAAAHGLPHRIVADRLTNAQIQDELRALEALGDLDLSWAAQTLVTYCTDAVPSTQHLWLTPRPDFDVALREVSEGRDTISEVATALAHRLAPSTLVKRLTTENGPLQRGSSWALDDMTRRAFTDSRFELHDCPHCESQITTYIEVPENPRGLLCAACRRSPMPESPTFPASYFCFHELSAQVAVPPGVRLKRGEALSSEQEAAIVSAYQSGTAVLEIVKSYGVNTGRIYRIIDSRGIDRRTRKLTRRGAKSHRPVEGRGQDHHVSDERAPDL